MARAHVCKLGGRSWNTKAVGRTNATSPILPDVEPVSVLASRRWAGDPLPVRRLNQLAQHNTIHDGLGSRRQHEARCPRGVISVTSSGAL